MTTKEAREAKYQAEEKIMQIIAELETATGCNVASVHLQEFEEDMEFQTTETGVLKVRKTLEIFLQI